MKMNPTINMETPTEIRVLELCTQGDQAAFEQLVTRYQGLLCAMAYSAVGNSARSEDLAQETFIIAWKDLKTLRDRTKFKSWLCGIARNLINQSIRKESRNPATSAASFELVAEAASVDPSPAEEVIRAEEEALVWQSLEKIPETYREPLVLYYREDQSISRVAGILDLTTDTVKQRLSRGRKMLRNEVTSLVESTLTKSKPTGTFTAGVIMALPFAVPKSAAAAGAAGTAAKATGAIFKWASAVSLIKLMVMGWCLKVGFDSNRSPREKRFYVGISLLGLVMLILYCITLFAPESIGLNFMTGSPSRPAILMVITIFPYIIFLSWAGRHLKKIRIEEKNWVDDQSVIGETADSLSRAGLIARFAAGTFGVAAWLGVFAIFIRDWTDLAIIIATAGLAFVAGTAICLRHPKKYPLVMGLSVSITGWIVIEATRLNPAWLREVAETGATGGDWLFAAYSGTLITIIIVTLLAVKRSDAMQRRVLNESSAPEE